jgi:NAD(P)H-hydrate repair Nnr-like enzyme with NAD(P)H-hydrate epimerase domain
VGKIEAEHADSGFGQSQKFFTAVGGGANGGDDLGFHGLFPNMPC